MSGRDNRNNGHEKRRFENNGSNKKYGQAENASSEEQEKNERDKRICFLRDDKNYVDIAKERITRLGRDLGNDKYDFGNLTTSKIRNILSIVNDILNDMHVLHDNKFEPVLDKKLKRLKIKLIYEAGRDEEDNETRNKRDKKLKKKEDRESKEKEEERSRKNGNVKRFIIDTGLLDAIDEINGDKEKFKRYANYLEALVAYHRYYGGKDF